MDMEVIYDLFDPRSLRLHDAEPGDTCGYADPQVCGAAARFVVHFHLDSAMVTECVNLTGCREHAVPLWETLWLNTPQAS